MANVSNSSQGVPFDWDGILIDLPGKDSLIGSDPDATSSVYILDDDPATANQCLIYIPGGMKAAWTNAGLECPSYYENEELCPEPLCMTESLAGEEESGDDPLFEYESCMGNAFESGESEDQGSKSLLRIL